MRRGRVERKRREARGRKGKWYRRGKRDGRRIESKERKERDE